MMQLPESFFQTAKNIYQNDPYWLGENPEVIQKAFSDSSDYQKNGGQVWADVITSVNDNGSEELSRLAGFYDPNMKIDGESVAYFGFWETADSTDNNTQLFQRFESWAKEQGAQTIYGPINFNTYGLNRIQVFSEESRAEGKKAETAPFIGEPYNPEYYASLLDGLGYSIRYRYFTRINNNPAELAAMVAPILERGKTALAGEFEFHRFTGDIWREKLSELYPITDKMFRNNFAYSPISEEQFKAACGEPFAKKLCPNSSVLVTDRDGSIAGYFLVFPDFSPLIRQGITTAEEANFEQHFDVLPEPCMALAKTGAVHPDYRKAGLFTLMSMQLTTWGAPYYQRMAASLVREDNPSLKYASNGEQERGYALYFKKLNKTEGEV
ncbi:hypothetical protein [Bacterioplanoides sp. SCSIO 12839]|uniref:hypothetical protein n=1 Tax=Bacterioplanoides sp. SCSIO 12839 TaxID=2829569 RepID=UPI0021046F2F|nr:hypothetical protein [Bacterioplanoides sp. SCSIO 12839]UTW49360.1 hypothetical protein KFF03_05500 [Bacterioplanoides sp. SCSIO 12839]